MLHHTFQLNKGMEETETKTPNIRMDAIWLQHHKLQQKDGPNSTAASLPGTKHQDGILV